MSNSVVAPTARPGAGTEPAWHGLDAGAVLSALESERDVGLTAREAAARRDRFGPNEIASEPAPSVWAVAVTQLKDPMNLMLVAVVIVSVVIGEIPTALVVAVLVLVNIVLGTQQELKARASVDALAKMQTPQARVLRDGQTVLLPATELVPGDIVDVEAGDVVPADGRLLRSATLETQEASLTGESAPIAKDPATVHGADVGLGDRSDMLYQNTSVTRGTATMVVTETGMATQMGRIASMLSAVAPSKSPLQRELDSLTKVLGIIAWTAVAVIVVIGLLRGQTLSMVLLLGISMGVSAIPTGLPTFVQAMLAFGARQLAEAKAVVKNLSDVETLGATSAINSDKTGTLTMNQMTVRSLYFHGQWYAVDGEGYAKTGKITPAPRVHRSRTSRCWPTGSVCDSDATVSDAGAVVGDPTEAALVVLAAKVGVDAALTRRGYPRVAEVPFDSAYKFMATFHHLPVDGTPRFVELVKGGPDVVLARCGWGVRPDGETVRIGDLRAEIDAANRDLSEQGLRVLAFAYRHAGRPRGRRRRRTDGFRRGSGVRRHGRHHRPAATRGDRRGSHRSCGGHRVRMITGDHAITPRRSVPNSASGPGAMSGTELAALTDDEFAAALPNTTCSGASLRRTSCVSPR